MSDKCYSTFVADHLYYDFIALLNSWRYYEHKYPLKVYVGGELSPDKIKEIEKHCEVVIDDYGIDPQYKKKFVFKYLVLSKHMSKYEICIDVDTLFLSNLDHLFSDIEQGKLVVARENFADLSHCVYNSQEEIEEISKALVPYLGYSIAKKFNKDTSSTGYNGGFLGLNKSHHEFLLNKVVEILRSDLDFKKDPVKDNEQYMMCFLLNLFELDKIELPQTQWMNTWDLHANPKKVIRIDNGKLALFNTGNTGITTRVNFYHFTGGLFFNNDQGNPVAGKPYMIKDPDKKDIIEKLYYQHFESPALLLYEYFLNKGI